MSNLKMAGLTSREFNMVRKIVQNDNFFFQKWHYRTTMLYKSENQKHMRESLDLQKN